MGHSRYRYATTLVIALVSTLSAFAAGAVSARGQDILELESMTPFQLTRISVPNPNTISAEPRLSAAVVTPVATLRVDYYIPTTAATVGVAYFFHGGEGNVTNWSSDEEQAALMTDLVRLGYGVVLVESTHRTGIIGEDGDTGFVAWHIFDPDQYAFIRPDTINADEMLVRTVHKTLTGPGYDLYAEATSATDRGTPIYLVGFSSGGRFAAAMGYWLKQPEPTDRNADGNILDEPNPPSARTPGITRLNVRGVAVYCHVTEPWYYDAARTPVYSTPLISNVGDDDDDNPIAERDANLDLLRARGVAVEANTSTAQPLRRDRMARVVGISHGESRWFYEKMAAWDATTGGTTDFMDDRGNFLVNFFDDGLADELDQLLDEFEGELIAAGRTDSLRQASMEHQLKVLLAEHHPMSDFHHRTVRWFETHK
jgi:hypothetical protein